MSDYALPGDDILSPALVVYVDQVRDNLRRMFDYLDGDLNRWRPHIKTTKIPEVLAELVRAGVRHFKCATTREAAVLLGVLAAEGGAGADLLVAYPHRPPALARLKGLAREHPDVKMSVLCEDPALVDEIVPDLSVFVDLNPGMNRTGLPPAQFVTVLEIARGAGDAFRGLHYYDGHIHHGGDAAARRAQAFAGYRQLLEQIDAVRRAGLDVEEIITSGTPAFRHALAFEPFRDGPTHRVSPGTVVYHDTQSAALEELDLVPAALVFTRVISHPGDALLTCDAGSKSVAAEAGHPCVEVLGHPGLVAQRPSEEHLPMRLESGARPPLGAPLLLIPRHVCPTVNLAEQAVLIEEGRVRDIVFVAARAHDVR